MVWEFTRLCLTEMGVNTGSAGGGAADTNPPRLTPRGRWTHGAWCRSTRLSLRARDKCGEIPGQPLCSFGLMKQSRVSTTQTSLPQGIEAPGMSRPRCRLPSIEHLRERTCVLNVAKAGMESTGPHVARERKSFTLNGEKEFRWTRRYCAPSSRHSTRKGQRLNEEWWSRKAAPARRTKPAVTSGRRAVPPANRSVDRLSRWDT